jgi:hypothetical protein
MKVRSFIPTIIIFLFLITNLIFADNPRYVLDLCGQWEFDQTVKAYPSDTFTRTIQVPGLIDLAEPKIDQYDELFMGDHDPKYSWYRYKFFVPEKYHDKRAVLTILKSRFNTQVILNDIDLGTYMECSTPIECDLTPYLIPDEVNILMIRVDDIRRIPKQSAYSMDIEQFTYIPGIWDNVYITFTGPIRIARTLILPEAMENKVTLKIMLENHDNKIKREFSLLNYKSEIMAFIREKESKKQVTNIYSEKTFVTCLHRKEINIEIPLKNAHLWSPNDPFLYEAVIEVKSGEIFSDRCTDIFGMRDFGTGGKSFVLNGKKIVLLGSNITLSRFFGDPERSNLPWNKKWVKKLLIDIPKALRWNAFRNSIGLLPDFWYDLADEYGILIQNEWPMWKNRGWDKQIEKEYTDWIWTDGSHPSIIIWDAMNESRHEYIGNVVIPKLKKLDPTRIWDAGYMNERNMSANEMDEPHYYPLIFSQRTGKEKVEQRRLNYRFGKLFYKNRTLERAKYSPVPQLVNEYAWLWMDRDGTPSFISKGRTDPDDRLPQKHYFRPMNEWKNEKDRTIGHFEYFLGPDADNKDRWDFQAYYIQLQTEELRSRRYIAGLMSFTYLTFNKGYTGDWFLNPIKDLIPGISLKWQFHCFSPFAIFIDLEDGRYLANPIIFEPGKYQEIILFGINDTSVEKKGLVILKIIDTDNNIVSKETFNITIDPHFEELSAVNILLPEKSGGYLLMSELSDNNITQICRRYIRVGEIEKNIIFPEYNIYLFDN